MLQFSVTACTLANSDHQVHVQVYGRAGGVHDESSEGWALNISKELNNFEEGSNHGLVTFTTVLHTFT